MTIKAVIFDLDGVLTDTAEYHFRAWKRLADEENISFTREDNEQLRGVSRRESLLRLLKSKVYPEAVMQDMMARKNGYYTQLIAGITSADLLPGVVDLLDQLDAAGMPYAVASASHNAQTVLNGLGIMDRLTVLADGGSVPRTKPAPDLFRFAAASLGFQPHECLVVEDAEAGIEAALTAGMPCLALGPAERFADLKAGYGPFVRHEALDGLTIDNIQAIGQLDETWCIVESAFEPAHQHHMETVFTTGSGYFCSRGTFEESYPGDYPLTLAHGMFDDMPVNYTELVNMPAWLDTTITIDGELLRLDRGTVLAYRRYLDLRQGVLHRAVRWQSPGGAIVDLTFQRFVSYAHEHVGALRLLVTPVNRDCHVEVATGIDGHISNDDLLHWHHLDQGVTDGGTIWLHSRTRHTHIELATAATITAFAESAISLSQCPGHPRLLVEKALLAAQTLQIDKLVSYATSRDYDQKSTKLIEQALFYLDGRTFASLLNEQTSTWDALWDDCDVVIEGDTEAQIAIRFNLFQLLIAASQHDEYVSIGAKALSGLGYRGHVFWDTETFILPFFIHTKPALARNMLMYRYHTLPGARQKAADNGFCGAQYAWESAATGEEVTPTWVPHFDGKNLVRIWTGDIEIHISADIAFAIMQYWELTGDDAFLHDYGAEIILSTACFWGDRAEYETTDDGYQYAFRDVIGPDEYHDHVDNNAFTNRMAQWHLQTAQRVLDWLDAHHPEKSTALRNLLDLCEARLAHWQDVIDHIVILHDPETGLITQFECFFDREFIPQDVIENTPRSMQIELGIEGANASQVLKQADVIMLLCLLRDEYDRQTWQANWDTYMPRTDHQYGSSLSPSFHAWAACEMDRPDEGYTHFMRAARADLRDVRGNANDGIHAASAGGLWQAVVFGFAGLRLGPEGLTVNPKLPSHWRRLSFNVVYRGQKQRFEIEG
jgi:beta-phosphoglucomutase